MKSQFVISEAISDKVSRSQIVTLKHVFKIKYPPYAFTEQGVAMLSSILRSKRAIQVNTEIMRAFVKLRQILASHVELARKLEALERKYDSQFKIVFDAIRQLMAPKEASNKRIGFQLREKRATYFPKGLNLVRGMKDPLSRIRMRPPNATNRSLKQEG